VAAVEPAKSSAERFAKIAVSVIRIGQSKPDVPLTANTRQSRESWKPVFVLLYKIPAFARTTEKPNESLALPGCISQPGNLSLTNTPKSVSPHAPGAAKIQNLK
jgi:hypothetical protein